MTSRSDYRPLRHVSILNSERGTTAAAALDFIRGLSAMLVCFGHGRSLFFSDFENTASLSATGKMFYLLTGFGHQAVIIFFVLSGFFISASVYRKHKDDSWSFSSYLADRACRLYLVLVPGLFLTLALDSLGLTLFESHSVYQGTLCNVVPAAVEHRIGTKIFVGNLLGLQTVIVPPLGTNGPLWSLSNEYWYYILFPLLVMSTCAPAHLTMRIGGVLIIGGLLFFLGVDHALYFVIWLVGALIPLLPPFAAGKSKVFWLTTVCSLLLFLSILLLVRVKVIHGYAGTEYLTAFSFAALLYCLLQFRNRCRATTFAWISECIASFSYSLYVVHLPILVFFRACLAGPNRWRFEPTAAVTYVAVMAITVILAILFAKLTEDRTPAVRRAIASFFKKRTTAVQGRA